MLPMQEPEQEHVARDALQFQAQVPHLQLRHPGMNKNSKFPKPAGWRRVSLA
jgi:hypothetical protein